MKLLWERVSVSFRANYFYGFADSLKSFIQTQNSCDVPEQSGISGQSSNGDADVVVDMENLLLVGSQFRLGSLQRHKNMQSCMT